MADNKKVLYEFNEDSENGVFMIEVEEAVAESNHDYYDENATRGGDDKSEKENKKVATTFEKALSPLKSVLNSVAKLKNEASPDEMSIEMGVKIGGKAGMPFVILATTDYHLKVTMKWTKKDDA
jgi:hypothetical protein